MKVFKVPAGIGDWSFTYTKVCSLKEDIGVIVSGEQPRRTGEFIDILPHCKFMGYGNFGSHEVLTQKVPDNSDITKLPDGEYFLGSNWHLESGHPIATFLPNLPIDYHYSINFLPTSKGKVDEVFAKETGRKHIGIYASCYSVNRYWNFWKESEWLRFMQKLNTLYDRPKFYLIGASFDIDLGTNLLKTALDHGLDMTTTIGFHISDTIWLIKQLDYLFAFPSGIGILGDVVNTRTMMFMPPNLEKMIGTFADPKNTASGQFKNCLFTTPEIAFDWVKENWSPK